MVAARRICTRKPDHRVLYKWYDDGGEGKVTIRISLTDQIAEFKRGDRDIGWCYVATGKEGHGTAPGTYQITEKIEDKHSNLYGWLEDEFGNVTDDDAKIQGQGAGGHDLCPGADALLDAADVLWGRDAWRGDSRAG